MNDELEALVLAYEAVSASRGEEAERCLGVFEALLDKAMSRSPSVSRDLLRKCIIRKHREWALRQEKKPPAIPPKA